MAAYKRTTLREDVNRWLSEQQRKDLRSAVADYDRAIAQLRKLGKHARDEQRATCSAQVTTTRDRARELFRAAVEAARAERQALVGQARSTCQLEAQALRQRTQDQIAEQKNAKKARRQRYRNEVRREKHAAARERERTASRLTHRQESDEAIRASLEVEAPELVPAWDRWGHKKRATKRASKREVFLEWAGEHPEEVLYAREDAGRRSDRQLAREQREALLAEVPF